MKKIKRSNSKALVALLSVHLKAEYEFWKACKEMGHYDEKRETTATLSDSGKSIKFSFGKKIKK